MRKRLKGGIRLRLLSYAVGIALPLALVGLGGIWTMSNTAHRQLEDSIKKQAEITAVAFEQWLQGQRKPLNTLAGYIDEHPSRGPEFIQAFRLIAETRSYWAGLRVLSSGGQTDLVEPQNAPRLTDDVIRRVLRESRGKEWVVDTDWPPDIAGGFIVLAVPTENGGAIVAQIDVATLSTFFLKEVKLSQQSVLSILGPHNRIILYRNPTPETYIGKDMSDSAFYSALADQPAGFIELKSPIDGIRRGYGLARTSETGCVALVGLPSTTLYAPARAQRDRFLIFSVAAILLAIVAAIVIARGIANPVRWLTLAARRFGSGELSTRASFNTSGELEELRESFNSMAEEIARREGRLKELDLLKSDFVSGVSHEMRTPLTTVKTLARVLRRGNVTDSEREEFLETIEAECDRQIDLVLNLLDLSRIESGTFSVSLSSVDVGEIINSCITMARHNNDSRGKVLNADLADHLPKVQADRTALRRTLCSLVENAVKYTPENGTITISAIERHGMVDITVSDTGRGIVAEDLPHIFDKFYRGRAPALQPTAATVEAMQHVSEPPGVGLGLYLARRIVEEIGGQLSVESTPGLGSNFTISLPVWTNQQNRANQREQC